jgi:hypothetical protein
VCSCVVPHTYARIIQIETLLDIFFNKIWLNFVHRLVTEMIETGINQNTLIDRQHMRVRCVDVLLM